MIKLMGGGCALIALLTFAPPASAGELTMRPQAGLGELDGKRNEHLGLRMLLSATGIRRYGLELSRLSRGDGDYVAAGIVLEQRLFGWFNMSIGTIGYFGQGNDARNHPGLVANLGWEPDTNSPFMPFVTLRNDVIFADNTQSGAALCAGFSIKY